MDPNETRLTGLLPDLVRIRIGFVKPQGLFHGELPEGKVPGLFLNLLLSIGKLKIHSMACPKFHCPQESTLKDLSCDDDALDFRRALIKGCSDDVPEIPFHRILFCVAVATEHLEQPGWQRLGLSQWQKALPWRPPV